MNTKQILKFLPVLLLALLTACGGNKKAETDNQKVSEKRKVKIEAVSLTMVEQNVDFTATVEADKVNNIAPAMGGRIRNILVDVGTYVSKGQALVQMDKTNLSQQETQLATLKRDYERYKELYEVGGVSKQQLDQLKTQMDVAQTAMNNMSENTLLRSPISGVVTKRNYDPGDVAAGLAILTVESINPVKVLVNVSETFYSQVKKGMKVNVKLDALENQLFTGTVSVIYPTLDPVSHTFPVEIIVNNTKNLIRPGMFARVQMNFGSNERPLVADMAVLKQSGSNDRYVFVEKEGKAVFTHVELGIRIANNYEIVSGLHEGDRVIVQGNTGLVDGMEVEVVK